jgi:hypothetical protein
MHFLREPIGKIMLVSDYNTAYEKLLKKLHEMHFEIQTQNKIKGEIVVRCLSNLINIFFWRCWSDKLIFDFNLIDGNRTEVEIFAVPNLFRIKVNKGETLIDLNKLLFQLKEE